jgi:hypothetical protein
LQKTLSQVRYSHHIPRWCQKGDVVKQKIMTSRRCVSSPRPSTAARDAGRNTIRYRKKYDIRYSRLQQESQTGFGRYHPVQPSCAIASTATYKHAVVGGGAKRVYSITGGAHSLSSHLSPSLSLSNSLPLAIWSMIPSGTGSAGAHWCALAAPPSMKSGISSTATCQCLGVEV